MRQIEWQEQGHGFAFAASGGGSKHDAAKLLKAIKAVI